MPAIRRLAVLALALLSFTPSAAFAQHDHAAMMAAMNAKWKWTVDASGTLNLNIQERKFTDVSAWESQNWVMFEGVHRLGRGTFRFHDMHTLEPFTMHALGSPQAFQTGETFRNAPLIDYQHPHDLFMSLGADYTRMAGGFMYTRCSPLEAACIPSG